MSTEDEIIAEFKRELAALTKKHRVSIGGCGCCGSPWLTHHKADDKEFDADGRYSDGGDDLKWIGPA